MVARPLRAEGTRGSALRVARALALLLLAYVLCSVVVPLQPLLGDGGLDGSWALALNQAVAQGLHFGTEVVFTYGPYASLLSAVYHPATDARMLWGSAYLALSFLLVLPVLLRGGSLLLWLALVLALAIGSESRDALLLLYPLAAGLLAGQVSAPGDEAAPRHAPLLLVLAFAPFGLLALAKGSLLLLCAAMAGFACLGLLLRGRVAWAGIVAGTALASFLFFWRLAAQPLENLPAYVETLAQIIRGYGPAMGVPGRPGEWQAYLAAAALLLVLGWRQEPRGSRGAMLVVTGLALLLVFKAGFVRHDDKHVEIAAAFLLLAAALLAARGSLRSGVLVLLPGIVGWAFLSAQQRDLDWPVLEDRLERVAGQPWMGLAARASGELAADHARRMAWLGARGGTAGLQGTSDVYSFGQGPLIASGAAWSPRPVLQSYSAYTPELAGMNRDHLLSARAPHNVVFRVEGIDQRLPALDDGASWPALLRWYQPVAFHSDALILRRSGAAAGSERAAGESQHALGEWVALPAGGTLRFARIAARQAPRGKLAAAVHRAPGLRIAVRLVDGSEREFKLVPAMAEAGFLLSPLVENAGEFGLLYGDERLLTGRRVLAFRVMAEDAAAWEGRYRVAWSHLALQPRPEVPRMMGIAPFVAARPGEVVAAASCQGVLETVNGQAPGARPWSGQVLLPMQGWLTGPPQAGAAPGQVVVVASDARGELLVADLRRIYRYDLVMRHGRHDLAHAGFSGVVDASALRGAYRLRLGLRRNGAVQVCPGQEWAVSFAG